MKKKQRMPRSVSHPDVHKEGRQLSAPVKDKSFFRTLLFSLLGLSVSITLLLTLFLTANYFRTSLSITTAFNRNLLSQTNYTITQMDDNAQRLTQALFGDKDIISFLNMKEHDSMIPILASRTLDKQLMTLPFVDSIYLYNASLDLFFSSKSGEQLHSGEFKDEQIAALITDPAFAASYSGIPIPGTISGTSHVAKTLSYLVFDSTQEENGLKNAIIINVNPSLLTDSMQTMNQFEDGMRMDFVIMDKDGSVISTALSPQLEQNSQLYEQLYAHLHDRSKETGTKGSFLTIGDIRYFQSVTAGNKYQWYLMSLIPASVIFKDILTSSLAGAGIMLGVLLLGSLICLSFARRLNSPIQAITHMIKGEPVEKLPSALEGTQEFRLILDTYKDMKKQNRQFEQMKRETAYSIRQDCLNNLLTGNNTDPMERISHKLQGLNLSRLLTDTLCMAVLKIDSYDRFLAENNPKELWVLRFAIVNIMEEIASGYFPCQVFSRDNDKFVVLISCEEGSVYRIFQNSVNKMLLDVQENVKRCMDLSLSAAYSTFFKGIEHFPSMYHNMKDSLLLKMKYGHGCIISPYMVDELETGSFQFPSQKADQLSWSIAGAKTEQALELYRQITEQLFTYDYNEIISGSIHLAYTVYTEILQKFPGLKEEGTSLLRKFLAALQDSEISGDIVCHMEAFIRDMCGETQAAKEDSSRQNTNQITQNVCRIIDRDYSDPALCLSSIAEEIGLSPNYIGQIFKTSMQKSVAQYILDLRMDTLSYYLEHTSLSLSRILEKVGIEKNNYFYTQFKKHFGMSLGDYRKNKNQMGQERDMTE